MTITPVKWMVDDNTYVELEGEEVTISQGDLHIFLTPTGASINCLIDTLVAVSQQLGYDIPDSLIEYAAWSEKFNEGTVE